MEGVATGLCLDPSNSICSIVLLFSPLNLSFVSFPSVLLRDVKPQSVRLHVQLHSVLGNKFGYRENIILMLSHNLLPQLPCKGFNAFFFFGVQNRSAWSLTSHRMVVCKCSRWFIKSL